MRNRSVPDVTVIPVVPYPDVAEATGWLCRAFGFRVRLRIADHRAQLTVDDGAVIVVRAPDDAIARPSPVAVHVRVIDADRHHDDAVRAGARIVSPPIDYPFGERQYTAEDPAGHRWTFSQSIADVDPADWGGTLIDPD